MVKTGEKMQNFVTIFERFFEIKNPVKRLFQASYGILFLEAPPRFELGNKGFADHI